MLFPAMGLGAILVTSAPCFSGTLVAVVIFKRTIQDKVSSVVGAAKFDRDNAEKNHIVAKSIKRFIWFEIESLKEGEAIIQSRKFFLKSPTSISKILTPDVKQVPLLPSAAPIKYRQGWFLLWTCFKILALTTSSGSLNNVTKANKKHILK